jgi:hypothetical protein
MVATPMGNRSQIWDGISNLSRFCLAFNIVLVYTAIFTTTKGNSTFFPLLSWQWSINESFNWNPH